MYFASTRPTAAGRNTRASGRHPGGQPDGGAGAGVLVDLAGPKIRLGELPGGELECATGDRVRFVRGDRPAVRRADN